MTMPVSPALLLLCAAIPAASAFAPVFSLSAPRHSGFAARVSHVGPTAAGWAGLRGSPALRTAHRATRGGAASMIASTAVGVESLADRVAAAQPGDTIILEKVGSRHPLIPVGRQCVGKCSALECRT
ncbi:hypothetical protein T484DRAFT_1754710 [Baffinella frigidus]|nr:hypothetical protein T484DRAFT_1754710 [Cryptophyta sp. CCMP2293]